MESINFILTYQFIDTEDNSSFDSRFWKDDVNFHKSWIVWVELEGMQDLFMVSMLR